MFTVIDMAAELNNGADSALLSQAVGEEYAQETAAGKVAGTTDTVHQLSAANMRAVNVTINIAFNSGVHSDNANTTSNFRVVGNFLRTQDQMLFIFSQVSIEFL